MVDDVERVAHPDHVDPPAGLQPEAVPALQLARELPGAIEVPFLGFIEPALATLVPRPRSGDKWVHEIKYDGYRFQCHVHRGVRFFTRLKTVTARWPKGMRENPNFNIPTMN